jgi:polyisoprenoid-binding protein YceI
MKSIKHYFNIALFLIAIPAQAQKIDSEKSVVNFSLSNLGFNTVEGTFKGLKGDVYIDDQNLAESSIKACLKVSTVNTGNSTRDEHLLKDEFFATETYPQICFSSSSFSKTAEGYLVKGLLSIRGISKEVSIPFELKNREFIGHFSINRLDFKVGEEYNTFTIGNEVELEITCIGSKPF